MPTAREYLRVSIDKSGRERSNEEQQQDNRATWDFDFGDPYSDATSASRYARKARDDWPRLVADLEADRFHADVLVLWEGSRGSRRVGEWATLLDLCEARTVRIAVTEHDRIYDPAIPRDRKTLLEDAVDSEYESAKTSGRVRRASRQNALAGRPHGRVLFGYRRVYDPDTGELVGQEPHPVQADVVRRVFTDYAAGRSARSIMGALNLAGTKTNRGNGFTALMVHRMIRNPAYKARRVHKGEDFGPADWPALVDAGLWKRANDRHAAVAWQRTSHTASLLSGLVRCSVCGTKMPVHHAGAKGKRTAYYACQNGYHAARPVDRLDAFTTLVLLERLKRADTDEALDPDEDPALVAARNHLAGLKRELDQAMEAWKTRRLSVSAYTEMEVHLLPQITEAERALRGLEAVPLDLDLPEPDRVDAWWDGLAEEMRHVVMEAYIVSVTVAPTGRGRRRFDDAEYTDIEWRR